MIESAEKLSGRKRVLMLDMWSDAGAKAGASKKWLHAELEKGFETAVLNPGTTADNLRCLVSSFSVSRRQWGSRYRDLQEKSAKTPALFRRRSRRFQRAIEESGFAADAVVQIGGLFGPVAPQGLPYLTYHDQTVKMVEKGWPQWLPDDFRSFSDEWYALEESLYRSVSRVLTYSEFTRQSMIRDYGIAPEKVVVVPAACKMTPASAEEVRAPRKKQLLFVTTDFVRKGGDLLLAAFPLIKKAHPDATLLIVGGKLPHGLTIEDGAVRHAGMVPPQELRRLLLESALLVHPARYDAFPNAVKEAIACGLPVVASRRCGIDEIVADGECGSLIDELTPEAVASAVCDLLGDEDRLEALRAGCLSRSGRFKVDVIGNEFRRIIGELL